jgi:hypothetical protein
MIINCTIVIENCHATSYKVNIFWRKNHIHKVEELHHSNNEFVQIENHNAAESTNTLHEILEIFNKKSTVIGQFAQCCIFFAPIVNEYSDPPTGIVVLARY